jgi:hypothetical protein
MQKTRFNRWHERQLYYSFAWLISCLMAGFLFLTILEIVGLRSSGAGLIITMIVLYINGIAIIELFRRFWSKFIRAQDCASAATCKNCRAYGLFNVAIGAPPIHAKCDKCDHQWIIE